MNIAVIVTGYVGLVTGAWFDEFGLRVPCVEREAGKYDRLQEGRVPI